MSRVCVGCGDRADHPRKLYRSDRGVDIVKWFCADCDPDDLPPTEGDNQHE